MKIFMTLRGFRVLFPGISLFLNKDVTAVELISFVYEKKKFKCIFEINDEKPHIVYIIKLILK